MCINKQIKIGSMFIVAIILISRFVNISDFISGIIYGFSICYLSIGIIRCSKGKRN